MKTTTFKQFTLNKKDWTKAILIAVLTPVIFIIQQSLDAGNFNLNWKQMAIAAVSGFLAYIIKNFFAPTQTVVSGDVSGILNNAEEKP